MQEKTQTQKTAAVDEYTLTRSSEGYRIDSNKHATDDGKSFWLHCDTKKDAEVSIHVNSEQVSVDYRDTVKVEMYADHTIMIDTVRNRITLHGMGDNPHEYVGSITLTPYQMKRLVDAIEPIAKHEVD